MRITCPECQFSRTIDETKIPPRSVVATCPKCKTKFRFRADPEEDNFELHESGENETATTTPDTRTTQESSTAEQKPAMPELHDPAEKPGDELWRKIGDMPPPPDSQEPERQWAQSEEQPEAMNGAAGDHDMPMIEVPFERLDKYGFFPGLFTTIKRVLFSPRLFFSVMPLGRGFARPLLFALMILVLHDILQAAYLKTGILPPVGFGGEPISAAEASEFNPFSLIMFSPFMWITVLFFSAGVHHLLLTALKAAGGKFEATFRAAAYATAPIMLGYIPVANETVFKAQMMIIFAWNMVITVVGWKCLHKTSYMRAGLAAAIPMAVLILAMLSSMVTNSPTV
ncbi:YIP1 family protein [Pseudodesulfovibrio senegalensis]|uniref:Yip1 domain-containing protein n=1 Tax=Pseudodesulfovibrio senegalensis TaxID=1721087 RepID=A0A6N6N557_9BACT|nr:YIP1 family protein [Pseudodesulfovibrio senegalensis]KAB1442378.1 hypothetical protein F8A88_08015 [Pseudodesulfovibrio senegalensis]